MATGAEALPQLIDALYSVAEKGDYYALLRVPKSASPDAIRTAYFKLAKQLHPDRLSRLPADEKTRGAKLFQIVTTAYNTLSDPKKRDEYHKGQVEAATPTNPGGRTAMPAANIEAAKIAFHKGSVMLKRRSYAEAEAYFKQATQENPEVARYWQNLGWSLFNNLNRPERERLEYARKAYERALELDEEDAMTHYNVGLYWKAMGNEARMKRAMERAVECDPKFIEPQRELRLAKMRARKGRSAVEPPPRKESSGGFFQKLKDVFKKK